ncbi:hypothetical protein [uncultured Pontibacter sp.]|uniref:hypothetical protein n=1 Tax=uncultured Pontibacter sp. TaxID=453356 RepID=UPI002609F1B9|nr:hypothetical protein [uncultured Pontibacter sp.]
MHQLQLRLHYYKVLQSFNLPFSLFVSLFGLMFSQHVLPRMINAFSLSLLTGGFIISVYMFGQLYNNQYYFYHNMGISKTSIIASAFLFNLAVVILLWFLKLYLYA